MAKKDKNEGVEALETEYDQKIVQREVPVFGLKAGDLIKFDYQGSARFGIVVRSRRSKFNGIFKSTRGNDLLNIFLLNSITTHGIRLIINTLYKNRIRATYLNTPKILGAFLGNDNFRTFNCKFTSDVVSFDVTSKESEQEIDELFNGKNYGQELEE
jgi:hypothetical protein